MTTERTYADIYGDPCEFGHTLVVLGYKNAGCGPDCCCSVPVHQCVVCGDCDYGDNDEAAEIVDRCQQRQREK